MEQDEHTVKISSTPYHLLSREQVEKILLLQDKVWPVEKAIAKPISERVSEYFKNGKNEQVLILEENGVCLGHAEFFEREIRSEEGKLTVMGLASVCTHPLHRGKGFGKMLALKALEEVDAGRFAVSLFQTGVPEFYEKLGARKIENRFVNSLAKDHPEKGPWWNPYQMIYPADYPHWPKGEIDLLGPGY